MDKKFMDALAWAEFISRILGIQYGRALFGQIKLDFNSEQQASLIANAEDAADREARLRADVANGGATPS